MSQVLFTVVHNNLKYTVNTDHFCDYKLWIKVYDGNYMLCNIFAWLIYKSGQVIDGDVGINPTWRDAAGFNWYGLRDSDILPIFPEEVQKKLDSFFKLKAFW